mmetsp:Transcript_25310/g.40597  ORF Transcript_25310/g.40597 Transcript_25310/m.40597 type:complete len:128 (-) Transcript_25310:93-476(-)
MILRLSLICLLFPRSIESTIWEKIFVLQLNVTNKERKAAINEVLALVNSVAIRVSQQDFYLKSFNDVLLRLGELEITPKKPELRRQASWLGAIKGVGSATSEVVVGGDSQMCHGKKGNDDDDKGKQS